MLTENTKAIIAWLNVCVIWGTTYLVIRIGVGHLPPMLFAGIRWVIAGAIFIFFLRWRGKALPKAKEIVHLAVVGLALLGFANGLVVFAEQWIPSGLTALLLTTMPFFMVGLESLLPKGPKLNATILTGLIMGLVGVCLIFWEDIRYLADPNNLVGVLGLLGAVIFWSIGSLYSKYVKVDVNPLMGASVQMLIAGIFLSVVGISIGDQWTVLPCISDHIWFLRRIQLLHLCTCQIAFVVGVNLRLHQSGYCAILGMDHLG